MKTKIKPNLSFEIYLTITEEEARALNAISIYGSEAFLEMFYKSLGKTYLQPHEKGLKLLFSSIRKNIIEDLNRIDKTKKEWG